MKQPHNIELMNSVFRDAISAEFCRYLTQAEQAGYTTISGLNLATLVDIGYRWMQRQYETPGPLSSHLLGVLYTVFLFDRNYPS